MSPTDVLAERYGAPAPWRRRLLLATVGAVVLAGALWLGWTIAVHSTPEVTSELITFEVVDENTATAVLDVDLDDGGAATCTLRALAEDKSVVGQASLAPEPGEQTVSIRTERRATSVENLGCTAPGQNRPR